MSKTFKIALKLKWIVLVLCFGLALLANSRLNSNVYGAHLGERQLAMGTDSISSSTNYFMTFYTGSAGVISSVKIQFCSNDPVIADPCTAPVGFSDSNAVLSEQTGITGFSIGNDSTSNTLILNRTPTSVTVTPVQLNFDNITNPSVPGSYYVRIQTFVQSDGQGAASDYGGLAYAIVNNVSLSAEVPPYLIFCTGVTITGYSCDNAVGDYVDVGELSTDHASTATSQMLIATNANYGYGITMYGTTMTSGNNIIQALSNNDVSRPGTAQFGLNLRSNVAPPTGEDPFGLGTGEPTTDYNVPNSFRFDNGEVIASNSKPDNFREFTATYLVNVPNTQEPGIYVTTLTYIALATF
jgi:hypothetical protein